MFKKVKKTLYNTGFDDLKGLLDYLKDNNKNYRVVIYDSGAWRCSVGGAIPKRREIDDDDEKKEGD